MFESETSTSGQLIHVKKPNRAGTKQGALSYDMVQPGQEIVSDGSGDNAGYDGVAAIELHTTLLGHYVREVDRQAENRWQMQVDEDMYDNRQWTDEELYALSERGQAPLVFNVINNCVNWVLGTQRRTPTDFKILPRTKAGSAAAEQKTALMKYLTDVNHSLYSHSEAFRDATKVGIGWLETGQSDPEDGTTVFDRSESWRNMLWDSTAVRYDLSDARYIQRVKWIDVDTGVSMFPARAELIRNSASVVIPGGLGVDRLGDQPMDSIEEAHFNTFMGHSGIAYSERPRVRMIECWFKKPAQVPVMKGGQFSGELFDEWSPGHWLAVKNGDSSLTIKVRETIYVAIMTEKGLVHAARSPYRHNRYPFTPVWGYKAASDGMPYGMIRLVRDIQRDLNKRASKNLHILSTTRITVQEGAVEDLEELRAEAARPDAMIVHVAGMPPPTIETDTNLAAAHENLMTRDIEMIQQASGVTGENKGQQTSEISGKAITARQDQGSLTTSMFFDNLHRSKVLHGEKMLTNIEQFYTEEFQFRITNDRGAPDFKTVNSGHPDDAITETKADFIISEDDWHATARQAQAEMLIGLMTKLASTAPQVVMQTLDLVVESMDIPKRDEFVKRIRQLNGQKDPDSDPNKPDPEMEAKKQALAAQQAMQQRAAQAEIALTEAKVAQTQSTAAVNQAQAGRATLAQAEGRIQQLLSALQAAIEIAGAPQVAAAADAIIAHSNAASAPMSADTPPVGPGDIPSQDQPVAGHIQTPVGPPGTAPGGNATLPATQPVQQVAHVPTQ